MSLLAKLQLPHPRYLTSLLNEPLRQKFWQTNIFTSLPNGQLYALKEGKKSQLGFAYQKTIS